MHVCLVCARYFTRFAHLLDLQLTYVLPLTLLSLFEIGQADEASKRTETKEKVQKALEN
jgi:hypothetical protein